VDARAQAPTRAVDDFEKMHLPDLYKQKYPPNGHVYLRGNKFILCVLTTRRTDYWAVDMNKQEVDCHKLMETIAAVLDKNTLRQWFVSTQKRNTELCMKSAVMR
jgi:hypothetical protein